MFIHDRSHAMNDRRSLNPRSVAHWCAALGICATALGAWAADGVAIPPDALNDRPVASDPTGAPAPQHYGSVNVINGGTDSDEAAAIKRMASQYKLRVELSGQGGEYRVANRLQLVQGASVVADVPDAGPWLLLDVPAGRYTLVGDFADRQLRRDVTVAGTGTTVHWVLPARTN